MRRLILAVGLTAALATGLTAAVTAQAEIQDGRRLIAQADFKGAEQRFRSALRKSADDRTNFAAFANLGAVLYYEYSYERAEQAYRKALAIQPRLSPVYQLEAASVLNNLAVLYSRTGRLEEAERTSIEAVRTRRRYEPSESPALAGLLVTLASIYHDRGKYDEAELEAARAISILDHAEPTIQRKFLPSALRQLAVTKLARRVDLHEAGRLLDRARLVQEKLPSADFAELAIVYSNLGALRILEERYEDAALDLQQALETWKRTNLKTREAAAAMNNLAQVYKLTGRPADAEPLYRSAISICAEALGKSHPTCALFSGNLADLLLSKGQGTTALAMSERALQILAANYPPQHPDVIRLRDQVARIQSAKEASWSVALRDLSRRKVADPASFKH